MVINREFYFRGWLPAGLVVNARLVTSSPGNDTPVLKPVFNPEPGQSWDSNQPKPVFPVEQANETQAVILTNDFPEGALVMLPLGQWYGKGTPFVLATNTWYEGRIQTVSGGDIMAIRLLIERPVEYFSSSAEAAKENGQPDVLVADFGAYFIPGPGTRQAVFADESMATLAYENGCPTSAIMGGTSVPARVMDYFDITLIQVAGMRGAYTKEDPGSKLRYIQCEIASGTPPTASGRSYDLFGMIPKGTWALQAFYSLHAYGIQSMIQDENLLDPDSETTLGVISRGKTSDQITFLN